MSYHSITTKKRRKLFRNIREMCREFNLPKKIQAFCDSLVLSMRKCRKMEDLSAQQLKTLKIIAEMKVDALLMKAEDYEGSERAKLMLEASSWRNHVKSIESVIGA
jgi:hypothetical protein